MKVEPRFDPVRSTSRFERVLGKVGLKNSVDANRFG
jgi:hypothetical protein